MMTTVLHISASPRGQRSESLAIATTFLDELRATHPNVTVDHWDLWDGTLPEFGPPAAAAKMAIFGFDPVTGYTGLLENKRVAVIYTGAVYGPDRGPGFGNDFQQPYFEDWLGWAGIDDIRSIAFRPNLATADADSGRRAAHARATEVAREFLSPARSALLAG